MEAYRTLFRQQALMFDIARMNRERGFKPIGKLNRDAWPGIGAGLTIAKNIVERHDRKMQIVSEPGRGTNVLFWLPK
jgi:signal transduction histidine kinase